MALFLLAFGAILAPMGAFGSRASILSVSQSKWDIFNASVSGRLHNGEPMLAPCYNVYNGVEKIPDEEVCSNLQEHRGDPLFVSGFFGGYHEVNWEGCQTTGESCSFGFTQPDHTTPSNRPCLQGGVPSRYVDARNMDDIKKALRFARENNLRFVIKNTGHDYAGRSAAPDSFALWTHNIQPPIELTTGFTPEGCLQKVGDVITFGAGQQFAGLYEFANAHNYRVVGGSCTSVGAAGGWITGGGHGFLSNELGLGVDNVQQLKAVLPDGRHITANRCKNQDLFFALRGGGGGTFGVVTEMSTLAHPKKPMQFARITVDTQDRDILSEFLSIVVGNAERWASEGWGGFIQPNTVISGFTMGNFLLNHSEAAASMKPLIELANRSAGPEKGRTLGNVTIANVDYNLALNGVAQRLATLVLPGSAWTFASRIIGIDSFTGKDNQTELTSLLTDLATSTHEQDEGTSSISNIVIHAAAPFYYTCRNMQPSDHRGGLGAAAVTPAWRHGLWHLTYSREYDGRTNDPAQVQNLWQLTHDAMNPLRKFTPDSGAYLNEADPFEPDAIKSFWGEENYEKLLQIKKKIDPDNLLTVQNGIGWDKTDERYRCYPNNKDPAKGTFYGGFNAPIQGINQLVVTRDPEPHISRVGRANIGFRSRGYPSRLLLEVLEATDGSKPGVVIRFRLSD